MFRGVIKAFGIAIREMLPARREGYNTGSARRHRIGRREFMAAGASRTETDLRHVSAELG